MNDGNGCHFRLPGSQHSCFHLTVDKTHILNEIKRTAAANGGHPLGERAFYRETGIRQQDWLGKLWARFSDGVKEAGLTPNEFRDEQQYSDGDLLCKFATLAKELGELPTKGHLRLKKHGDATFPNDTTYQTRFGSKLELVRQLSVFCSSRSEFTSVLGLCREYLEKNLETSTTDSEAEGETGYVYLMKMGRFCKIGRANDLVRRGREITIQLPEKATMIHFFATDDPSGIEAYWHRRFEEKRREGEWFELSTKDIGAFRRRKSFM